MSIPVNEEFQQLVAIFDDDFLCSKLIDFLKISASNNRNSSSDAQLNLEIKCLDILNSLLHNRSLMYEKCSKKDKLK